MHHERHLVLLSRNSPLILITTDKLDSLPLKIHGSQYVVRNSDRYLSLKQTMRMPMIE